MECGTTAVTKFGKGSSWIRFETIKKGAISALIFTPLPLYSITLLLLLCSEVRVGLTMGSSISCPFLSSFCWRPAYTLPLSIIGISGWRMLNARLVLIRVISQYASSPFAPRTALVQRLKRGRL
jgi:hypothetical protein